MGSVFLSVLYVCVHPGMHVFLCRSVCVFGRVSFCSESSADLGIHKISSQ